MITLRAYSPTPKNLLAEPTIRARVKVPFLNSTCETEMLTFNNLPDSGEHLLIGFGAWETQEVPLVRIHSECLTGDVFGSARCDCGPQLKEAIELFSKSGGILIYMRQEGRGIGLYNKLDAYALQSQGLDTYEANEHLAFPADGRNYSSAAAMLKSVGKTRIKLLSNNPDKRAQLQRCGINVVEQIPTSTFENRHNRFYLETKRLKTGHTLEGQL